MVSKYFQFVSISYQVSILYDLLHKWITGNKTCFEFVWSGIIEEYLRTIYLLSFSSLRSDLLCCVYAHSELNRWDKCGWRLASKNQNEHESIENVEFRISNWIQISRRANRSRRCQCVHFKSSCCISNFRDGYLRELMLI